MASLKPNVNDPNLHVNSGLESAADLPLPGKITSPSCAVNNYEG